MKNNNGKRAPPVELMPEIMKQAGDVQDPKATAEDADAYVLALAVQVQREGARPCVVTNDTTDRKPRRISMVTACEQKLGLPTVRLKSFLKLGESRARDEEPPGDAAK